MGAASLSHQDSSPTRAPGRAIVDKMTLPTELEDSLWMRFYKDVAPTVLRPPSACRQSEHARITNPVRDQAPCSFVSCSQQERHRTAALPDHSESIAGGCFPAFQNRHPGEILPGLCVTGFWRLKPHALSTSDLRARRRGKQSLVSASPRLSKRAWRPPVRTVGFTERTASPVAPLGRDSPSRPDRRSKTRTRKWRALVV